MRHTMCHRKFNRTTNQRKALLSGLACSLIKHEQIGTTLSKANDLRPFLEPIITFARKKNTAHSFRRLYQKLRDKDAAHKVMGDLSVRTKDRPGGYLRIIKAGFRQGDNAPMVVIEFVDKKHELVEQKFA